MNVLYEPLPEEWNGYQINTWFQIGIQVSLVFEDKELFAYEKLGIIEELLFGEPDTDVIRPHPEGEELEDCIGWFLNGWNQDNSSESGDSEKVMDYEKDQWRIYADFRQIYGINLNESDLHWWEFCGLLWNMPTEQSSFFRVIEIRTKKITSKMSTEEKTAYAKAKQVYALEQEKKFTPEEEIKIDAYDEMMKRKRNH